MDNNDEISLVDLVAVLIRWRALVLGPVILALALAAAGFGLKFYVLPQDQDERRTETVMTLMPAPGLSSFLGSGMVETLALRVMDDPLYLDAALRKAGITKLNGVDLSVLDESRRLFAVRQLLIYHKHMDGTAFEKDAWLFSRGSDRGQIRMTFAYKDEAAAGSFLRELALIMDERVRELSQPFADSQIESYERLLGKPTTSEPEDEILAKSFIPYTAAKRFLGSSEPGLVSLHDPYVVNPEPPRSDLIRDYIKKSILASFAAGFLGVLLAFVAQAAASVRRDRAAMDKLKDAWYKR